MSVEFGARRVSETKCSLVTCPSAHQRPAQGSASAAGSRAPRRPTRAAPTATVRPFALRSILRPAFAAAAASHVIAIVRVLWILSGGTAASAAVVVSSFVSVVTERPSSDAVIHPSLARDP